MEDDLDAVSRGEREWVPLLEEFWKPFSKLSSTPRPTSRASRRRRHELGRSRERQAHERADGRYGAFVQIGTKEDEDKPKFAACVPARRWTRSRSTSRSTVQAAARAG
jgi:DNA topoisomerase-1